MSQPNSSGFELARRALPLIGLCAAMVLLVVLFIYLVDVFLLAFAGALLAIMLRAPTDWLAEHTRLPPGGALALVIVVVAALLGAVAWLFGYAVAEQVGALWRQLPELLEQVRERLADFEWLIGGLNPQEWLGGDGAVVGRGMGVVAATFGVLAGVAIVLFTALFFALQPDLYVRGLLQLVPRGQRSRAGEVLEQMGSTLRWWLLGQLLLMSVIAVITGIGLWALGVPYALALALLAGLLEFIPYLGPILAAIPAVLVALGESPQLALYVALFYLGIQAVEGNILQPLVQHRTVYLPPALVLLAQLVLGILVGTLGIMLATPLAATALVMTRMLYVQDVLGARRDR